MIIDLRRLIGRAEITPESSARSSGSRVVLPDNWAPGKATQLPIFMLTENKAHGIGYSQTRFRHPVSESEVEKDALTSEG